jgi:hypothetical protein
MAPALDRLGGLLAAAVAGVVAGALLLGVGDRVGASGEVGLVVALAAVALAFRPRLALGAAVGALVVLQGDPESFPGAAARLYSPWAGAPIAASDGLVGLIVGAAIVEAVSHRRPPAVPAVVALALAAMATAAGIGALVGMDNGATLGRVINGVRGPLYLAVLPIAVAWIARGLDRAAVVRACAAGAAFVVGYGLLVWSTRLGHVIADGSVVTYFDAAGLWIVSVTVLTICAAAAARCGWPRWTWLLAIAGVVVTALSLRRGFTVSLAVGCLAIWIVAAPTLWRPQLVFGLACAAAIAYLLLAAPFRDIATFERPAGSRITASFTGVEQGRTLGDAYRIAERRNVMRNIERSPLTGLGVAVPWLAYEPLPAETAAGRDYVHFAILFYWLKMGVAGALAYLLFMLSFVWSAWRLWRRHGRTSIGVAGLGVAVSLTCLLAVEGTATQTGVDIRLSLVMAVVYGLVLAAAEAPPSRARGGIGL